MYSIEDTKKLLYNVTTANWHLPFLALPSYNYVFSVSFLILIDAGIKSYVVLHIATCVIRAERLTPSDERTPLSQHL